MSVRIAGGMFAGRVLSGPPRAERGPGRPPAPERTRPTAVRLRKSLFAVLADELEGARVLDLCAGVGTLGFEAMSRGARECVFIERSPRMVRLIERNATRLGVTAFALVVEDALRGLGRLRDSGSRFDVVFLDPPWDLWEAETGAQLLAGAIALAPLVVAEHRASRAPPSRVIAEPLSDSGIAAARLTGWNVRTTTAGDGAFSLYRREDETTEESRTLS